MTSRNPFDDIGKSFAEEKQRTEDQQKRADEELNQLRKKISDSEWNYGSVMLENTLHKLRDAVYPGGHISTKQLEGPRKLWILTRWLLFPPIPQGMAIGPALSCEIEYDSNYDPIAFSCNNEKTLKRIKTRLSEAELITGLRQLLS